MKKLLFLATIFFLISSTITSAQSVINDWYDVIDESGYFYDGFEITSVYGEILSPNGILPDTRGPDIGSGYGSWRVIDPTIGMWMARTYLVWSPDISFISPVDQVIFDFNARMEGIPGNSDGGNPYCLYYNTQYDWIDAADYSSGTTDNWDVFVIDTPSTSWQEEHVVLNAPSGHVITRARYQFLRSAWQCSNDGIFTLETLPGVDAGDFIFDNLLLDSLVIEGLYQNPPTATATRTPTATGSPTVTRTPTVTATPRPIWDTPTPTPTGTLPPTSTALPTKIFDWDFPMPTKIPAIHLPAWPTPPTVSPWPGPPALLSLPPISPTSTLVPLSYPTPALFYPTATITPTATSTPPISNCYTVDFTGASLPDHWEIITGTFVPYSGIRFAGYGSTRWVELHNTLDEYFSSVGFAGTPSGHPMIYSIAGDSGETGLPDFAETLTFDPPRNYVGYTMYLEIVYTGETLITSAPYCTDTLIIPTATATATPTRNDIIAVMDVMASNLQAEVNVMKTPGTPFVVSTAPAEYAPSLPRNIAAVGWTIENMDTNAGLGFGLTSWASLFGYIISLPFQIAKMLYNIMNLLGPFKLFVIWLLLMLPFALWVKFLLFIRRLIISFLNLIFKIIQLIGDIWDLIPGL